MNPSSASASASLLSSSSSPSSLEEGRAAAAGGGEINARDKRSEVFDNKKNDSSNDNNRNDHGRNNVEIPSATAAAVPYEGAEPESAAATKDDDDNDDEEEGKFNNKNIKDKDEDNDDEDDDEDDDDTDQTKLPFLPRRHDPSKESATAAAAIPRKYLLVTECTPLKRSILSLQIAVSFSAINTKMLNPNFPIMVSPGHEHVDSFPNTRPFNFNSATYFIPMMSLLGVAISSIFVGGWSDRVGRKKPLVAMAVISGVGSIVKYFCRGTFWGFCIANFAFGFFLGNLPIAMAYVGDVYTSRVEKEKKLGQLVGNFVIGNSGGGMIAILMSESGLFAPLWVGAGLMFISSALLIFWLIEPGDERLIPVGKDSLVSKSDEELDKARPATIDRCALWNVIGGAVADNFGSTGLFPLCLSPLALEQFTFQFLDSDPPQEPIMSIVGFQWLSVCVALMVVPSTLLTPFVFRKIGAAGCCVFGNACTAVVTVALLLIGNATPTTSTFAAFVAVLYMSFPFTVFSQLTTGPMLDVLAPEDKLGYVQGLNNAAMNFGMAIAPWLFGVLADATTTNTAIWTGAGISVFAALVNAPLIRRPEMGPPREPVPPEQRMYDFEDKELVRRALDGEHVPDPVLFKINWKRVMRGKPFIVPPVRPYEEDKDQMHELTDRALETFRFRRELHDYALSELVASATGGGHRDDDTIRELCRLFNNAMKCDEGVARETTNDVGRWIGDYLLDNGYSPHVHSALVKQMVVTAFPPITRDREYTPENLEQILVKRRKVMNEYLEVEQRKKYSYSGILGKGCRPQFYS